MSDTSAILHIFHTNDFHGRLNDTGAARLRGAIDALDGAPYLLLDAGDAVKAGNIGVHPCGEPILDQMSDLGYHAMTMGNREFHVWEAALATKINRARFPVLCANVWGKKSEDRSQKTEVVLPVVPHFVHSVGGLTVAVFGLTVPMVTERMRAAAFSQFLFDDAVAAAKRQIVELRYKADILIALTHIGLPQDRKLAEATSGIDLIIGGHSHNVLTAPEVVNEVPIVQTGSHAHYFGHTTLSYSRAGVSVDYQLLRLQELAGKPQR